MKISIIFLICLVGVFCTEQEIIRSHEKFDEMFQAEKLEVGPPIYPVYDSCDYNYAPLGIMVTTLFIILFFLPLLLVADFFHEEDPEEEKNQSGYIPPSNKKV